MNIRRLFVAAVAALVSLAVAAGPPRSDFPNYGFVPKEDTGADRFLHKYPEYDGRGVVVAIFDTGVDPGAPGLQVTSDGKPKIVDIVDGSGSGDVDTSTVAEAVDGTLAGLTGRTLKLDPAWTCPTAKYHLGMKRAYELFPGELVPRLVAKRRQAWDAQQRARVVQLERQIEAIDAASAPLTKELKEERDELEERLALLKTLGSGFDDPGPVFDCVVFHDGEVWRAVVDTDEDGDLADEKLMTNYRLEHQYATFGDEDLMNFAVNIYDEGNLLSIVADSGSHGTHVAGIVAAYFPDRPELNGLAPGAQLVAVKIGDTRIGAAAVGTGEIRGCVAVLENHCDLINMSFGGPTADPDHGRNVEIYSEIVNKHGVIFCASAGNEGPALSTAGAPGATTSAILGIAAYISPDMQNVQYAMRDATGPTRYTFTSRGPTYDGDLGVAFAAPGGAIAPVPNWTLQGRMQAHGTSMASPNACGNIALLLSGLKARGLAYSPVSVRRAIENTARMVPGTDEFALGRGLMQTDQAFEYLVTHTADADRDVRYDVRVATRGGARGIYCREPWELERPFEARVMVTPVFHEDAPNRDKVDYELRCNIESTARWVECADHVLVPHGGRRLDIRVDPTRLGPGAHYAEVRGYDAGNPARGPIWRLPVTVIVPQRLEHGASDWREDIAFEPGREERRFLVVPEGATWADLRLRRLDDDAGLTVLVVQAVQLVPGWGYNDYEMKQYARLPAGEEQTYNFKVEGGRTLELCMAQYTGYLGRGDVRAELSFHGIRPDQGVIALNGAEVATRVQIETPIRKERIAPSGSLNVLRKHIRPNKSEIRPLDGRRDRLPEERQIYELVLTYPFSMSKAGRVTPRVAMMNFVDEKTWQSRMFMIFDASKRLVSTGWLDPSPVQLEKGDYTLKFHVRLDDRDKLEKLADQVLMLDHGLSNIGLGFFADIDHATGGGPAFRARAMERGDRAMIYVGPLKQSQMPAGAQPGDLLVGSVTFGEDGHRPGGYPAVYVVPPAPKPQEPKVVADDEADDRTPAQKLADALRETRIAQLKRLYGEGDRELFDRVAAELLADDPDNLPVLVEQLKRADGAKRDERLDEVVHAADRVIARIDQEALAAHYGVKLDPDDKAAAKVRKEKDEQTGILIDALHRKARALFDIARKHADEGRADTADDDAFEAAWAALEKWTDTTNDPHLSLHIDRQMRHGRLGDALRLLNGRIAENPHDASLYRERVGLLTRLGWSEWAQYEETWMLIRFPRDFARF